jgi:hypothetical protein
MLIEILYPKFGLVNGTTCIVYEIVMDDSVKNKNSTFIEPPLYVIVDFNTFISKHFNLRDINLNGFLKNVIPITPIYQSFNYQYDMHGPKDIRIFLIKHEKIPLNLTFFLID